MKIVYCCAFAHYSGHHPHVATIEPLALSQQGHEVQLLTFEGVTGGGISGVSEITVLKRPHTLISAIRKHTVLRWLLMVAETMATVAKAMRMNVDAIYIRDGDPFLFIPFLLVLLRRHCPHLYISVTGSVIFAPEAKHKGIVMHIYRIGLKVLACPLWQPLYAAGLKHNNITLIAQNDKSATAFRKTACGVFASSVECISRGVIVRGKSTNKRNACTSIGMSNNIPLLLSFGAPHQGKNIDVVFHAVALSGNIQIVHAGMHSYSLGGNPADMAVKYNLNGMAKVYDYFVSEDEKPVLFGAADAVVLSYTRVFNSTSSMLYEAAAYSVPVIASDNDPLGELVLRHNLGVVFKAEDVNSLMGAITRYLALPESERATMSTNCLVFAKENGLDKWARRCSDMIIKGGEVEHSNKN